MSQAAKEVKVKFISISDIPSNRNVSVATPPSLHIASHGDSDGQQWEDFLQCIPEQLRQRLFPHQVTGVQWLFNLHSHPCKGGILGDDMGLGKTLQVTSIFRYAYYLMCTSGYDCFNGFDEKKTY